MAQAQILPPRGECWTEVSDHTLLAAAAQAISAFTFGSSASGAPAVNVPTSQQATPGSSADVQRASSGVATITYAAIPGVSHVIGAVYWSYSGGSPPTDGAPGTLSINDGGANTILSVDITSPGTGFLPLTPPILGTPGNAMTVQLTAITGETGKITARHSTQ